MYSRIVKHFPFSKGLSPFLFALYAMSVTFDATGGLFVASILKFLDNVVKEYTGSLANLLTAVVCSYLFPDKFQFTVYVGLSIGCLMMGIGMYERYRKK